MNTVQFYCHTCEARVESATLEDSEYYCGKCNGPYVEVLDNGFESDDDFETEMVMEIADYDSDLSDVDMEDAEDERELETRQSQPYSFVHTRERETEAREPQPYSFVNARAGARESQPYSFVNARAGARESQPYSFVNESRARAQRRAQRARPNPPRRQRAHPFENIFMSFFQGQNSGFGPRAQMPAGQRGRMPQMPAGQPGRMGFAHLFQQMFVGQNSRNFFHGDMNELLAHFQRRHEDSGKPPAEKKDIEALPTQVLTEETAEQFADQNCAVCQDGYRSGEEICALGCDHFYHKDCVVPWLNLHRTCPLCRKEVGCREHTHDAAEQQSEAVM